MHLLHVLRADHPHVRRHMSLKKKGVPLRLLDSHMTAPAGPLTCSCPRFKNIFPPRLLVLLAPSAHPHAFCPKEHGHGGYILSMKRDDDTESSLPAAAIICCSNFHLSVSEMPKPCPLHTPQGPNPSSTTSSHQYSCIVLLEKTIPGKRKPHIALVSCCFLLLPPTASCSSSSPLLMCPRRWQDPLIPSCCIPETSITDSCIAQSPCFFLFSSFRDRQLQALLFHFHSYTSKILSAMHGSSLFRPSTLAVISSTNTFSVTG